MKILHATDIHACLPWLKWLVAESSKFDLVALTGDTLDLGDTHCAPDEQIELVLPYLRAMNAPLALCSGNHDVLPEVGYDSAQWMRKLKKHDFFIDDDVFTVGGYTFRCAPWGSALPVEATEDFWLAHAPPFRARTSTVVGGVSFGCSELRDLCLSGRGPLRCTLGGHVHSPLRFWSVLNRTISLNPGKGRHPTQPNHICLDLISGTATHHEATAAGIGLTTIRISE